jgi:hypothetical protein
LNQEIENQLEETLKNKEPKSNFQSYDNQVFKIFQICTAPAFIAQCVVFFCGLLQPVL